MTPRQTRALADELEPALRRAFLRSVQTMKAVPLAALVRAIEAGDFDTVARLVNVSRAAFLPLEEEMRAAYMQAGAVTMATINRPRFTVAQFAFDGRNLRAERYLSQVAGQRIVEIVTEQMGVIRTTLDAGQVLGQGSRRTALDLVGRVVGGQRQGGVIGLTERQAQAVLNMKADLADPARMANYFTRERRDRRFDSIARRALDEGKPVSQADIDRIAGRYNDRLLQLRGEKIARTETGFATQTAQDDALHQLKEQHGLRDEQIRRTWRTAADERVRESHVAMNGDTVGLDEPFSNGLMYPSDPNGPASEVIACRCAIDVRIMWEGSNL